MATEQQHKISHKNNAKVSDESSSISNGMDVNPEILEPGVEDESNAADKKKKILRKIKE